jgi:hypothetical protein
MSQRGNANPFEVLTRQTVENSKIDFFWEKGLSANGARPSFSSRSAICGMTTLNSSPPVSFNPLNAQDILPTRSCAGMAPPVADPETVARPQSARRSSAKAGLPSRRGFDVC